MKAQKCSRSCKCTFQIHATAHVCGSSVPNSNALCTEWQEKLQVLFWHEKLDHILICMIQVKHIGIAETFFLAVKFYVVNPLRW